MHTRSATTAKYEMLKYEHATITTHAAYTFFLANNTHRKSQHILYFMQTINDFQARSFSSSSFFPLKQCTEVGNNFRQYIGRHVMCTFFLQHQVVSHAVISH